MSALTVGIEILAGTNLGFTATALVGLFALFRRGQKSAPPPAWPRVLILRPCEGDEPGLFENLRSSLTVPYAGPRRVILLVPDEKDPAYTVASAVASAVANQAAISVLVTAPRPLENRKVAQLAKGFAHSDEEIVVCADSDVRLEGEDLFALVAALLEECDGKLAGAAFSAPIEVAPRTFWDRASAAVVGGSAQSFLALYGLSALLGGAPNMAGALTALRRSALFEIGGLEGVRDCLGEDNEIARRLVAANYRVALSRRPARCHDGGRSATEVIARVARWLTVVRAQRPGLLPTYPLLVAATPLLLLCALFHRSPILIAFTTAGILLRAILCMALGRFSGLRIGLVRALFEVFFGETLLLLGFLRAIFTRRISWRGHPFYVERGGHLRPASRPS